MMRNAFAASLFLFCVLGGSIAVPVLAATEANESSRAVALVSAGSNYLEWRPLVEAESITLSLADPQGLVRTFQFGPGTAPTLSFFDPKGMPLPDGLYTWELRVTPRVGRAAPLVQSGYFTLADGRLLTSDLSKEPERRLGKGSSSSLHAVTAPDQVVPDDLIVDGKGCVGLGCANGESFGAEALRLKQSAVRLRFEDTSAAAGFPTRDWQLTINDSASGGADRFSIDDLTAGTTPFTVRGAAPNSSLYIDGVGNVGLGTATPAQDLHIASGSTPTVRLEQTAGTVRTWDVGASQTSFFVKDVTNGSAVPFRVNAGAPTSSLEIATNGNVGLGTSSPSAPLQVSRATGGILEGIFLSNNNEARIAIQNTGLATTPKYFLAVNNFGNGLFYISRNGGGGTILEVRERLDANGAAAIKVNGSVEATNVVYSSSRELKENIEPLDTSSVLERLARLPVAAWSFKEDPSKVRHLGPMAEDFNGLFGSNPEGKTISLTDASGVALAAIQGLYSEIQEQQQAIEALRQEIERLKEEKK
jgi:hypothetical protein